MSRGYISAETRRLVAARAERLCEYCLVHEVHCTRPHEVDHIQSLKHGGTSSLSNLAFACHECNRCKGTDVGTILPRSGAFRRLYNPRTDVWSEHFRLDGGVFIIGITEVGIATARVLALNALNRAYDRQNLLTFRVYPPPAALKRMGLSE